MLSHVRLFATLWTVARQASLSMGLSRQESWSALPCPPPEDLPDPGIEPASPVSCIVSGFFTTELPEKPIDGMKMKVKSLSHVRLFATPWTVAHQAPRSMGFSRQESWSALPSPPPGDLPYPRIKPAPLASPALAGGVFTTSATRESL